MKVIRNYHVITLFFNNCNMKDKKGVVILSIATFFPVKFQFAKEVRPHSSAYSAYCHFETKKKSISILKQIGDFKGK